MIWAAVVIGKDGDFVITQVSITIIGGYERFNVLIVQGKTVGLFAGLLVVHGILVRVLLLCKALQNLTKLRIWDRTPSLQGILPCSQKVSSL